MADHLENLSHDRVNRYLRQEKLTPRLLWDNVKHLIQIDESAYIIFDDTVLDKRYSEKIELTRRQYSGNEHRVLRGIGVVTCVYVKESNSSIVSQSTYPEKSALPFFCQVSHFNARRHFLTFEK